MTTQLQIQTDIARFLARCNFGKPPTQDEDLFSLGTVTSLIAMQTVMFIEKRWNIRVPPAQLRRDNFKTVATISAMVLSCLQEMPVG